MHPKSSNIRIVIIPLAWLVSGFIGVSLIAQEFHIKGEVSYQRYRENFTQEFEFLVKGKAWQVVTSRSLPDSVFPGNKIMPDGRVVEGPSVPGRTAGDKIAVDRQQMFVLGAESTEEHYTFETTREYFLGRPAVDVPGQPPRPPQPPGERAVEMLKIFPGPVPWESPGKALPFLWLAFGSASYFAELKTNQVVPFYHQLAQRWGVRDYRQEARWRLAESVPHLPVAVTYMNPGMRLDKRVTKGTNGNTIEERFMVRHAPPYGSGFTNAVFTVLAVTNVGGLVLPMEFEFLEYDPEGGTSPAPVRTVRGKVHQLASYCPKPDLKFKFPGNVMVLDERVRTNSNMAKIPSYRSTRWLTTNEVFAMLEGRKSPPPQVLAVAAGKLPPKPRPWWQRVLAVVALGVPLGVVWWRFYRRGAGASAPPAK